MLEQKVLLLQKNYNDSLIKQTELRDGLKRSGLQKKEKDTLIKTLNKDIEKYKEKIAIFESETGEIKVKYDDAMLKLSKSEKKIH